MTERAHRVRSAQVDLGLATLVGPGHWLGAGQQMTTPVVAVAWAHVLSLLGLATVVTCLWLNAAFPPEPGAWLWVSLTWLSVGLLAVPLLIRMLPSFAEQRMPFTVSLTWRVAGIVLLIGMSTPLMTGWPILLWWPASVFLGTDISLTLRALGRATDGMRPLWSVLLSPLHVVVLVHFGLAAVLDRDGLLGSIGVLALITEAFVFTAYALAYPCLHLMARYEDEMGALRVDTAEAEHRDRAHWIHDEVLAELRLSRMRVQRGETSTTDLASELERIEHRLRLRQLDQVLQTGRATVAEIVQPFLRMARSADVELAQVPGYEVGSWSLTEETGRLLKRCLAVPVNNAIAAGARTLSIGLEADERAIILTIDDDAGGFEPTAEHAGRGLQVLSAEAGHGAVTVMPRADGTNVTARVMLRRGDLVDAQASASANW